MGPMGPMGPPGPRPARRRTVARLRGPRGPMGPHGPMGPAGPRYQYGGGRGAIYKNTGVDPCIYMHGYAYMDMHLCICIYLWRIKIMLGDARASSGLMLLRNRWLRVIEAPAK